jgi:hypothetical protein
MPGSCPGLSVVFSYERVDHSSTFKASELLLWVVHSCTVAFGTSSTAAQQSNTWYLKSTSAAVVNKQEHLKEI